MPAKPPNCLSSNSSAQKAAALMRQGSGGRGSTSTLLLTWSTLFSDLAKKRGGLELRGFLEDLEVPASWLKKTSKPELCWPQLGSNPSKNPPQKNGLEHLTRFFQVKLESSQRFRLLSTALSKAFARFGSTQPGWAGLALVTQGGWRHSRWRVQAGP